MAIGVKVVQGPASVFTGGGMAADGSEQSVEATRVEFLMSPLGPGPGVRVGGAVKSLGEVTEMLFGVEAIDDLPGLGKQFVGDVPNPGGAIPQDHGALHLRETAARGLAPDPLAKLRALRGGVDWRLSRTGAVLAAGARGPGKRPNANFARSRWPPDRLRLADRNRARDER